MARLLIDKMIKDEIQRPGCLVDPVRRLWYWFRAGDRKDTDITDIPVEVAAEMIWPWWRHIPLAHPVFDTPAGQFQSAAHFRMKKHDIRREGNWTSILVGQHKWDCAMEMYGEIRRLVSQVVGVAIQTGLRRDHMPRVTVECLDYSTSWKVTINANLWG